MVVVATNMAQSSTLLNSHLQDNIQSVPLLEDEGSSKSSSKSSQSSSTSTEDEKSKSSTSTEDEKSSKSSTSTEDDKVSGLLSNVSIQEGSSSDPPQISFIQYQDETQMPLIMKLIQKDLSEPYSIYTYRYFIHNWPNLCFLAMTGGGECVGAIVCKLDLHKKVSRRGYIAMLAVDSNFRKLKIGSTLVKKAIEAMIDDEADEVVLETEITNKPALKLYENLGFVRDKRLFRYYLNGVDASRLKLWLR